MEEGNNLERRDERFKRRREDKTGGPSIWHAVGGIALVGLAALVIVSIPDISRYIKISRM